MIELLKVNQLEVASNNARRSPANKSQDAELKASIAVRGILQNLVVGRPNTKGVYPVQAGSRRLRLVEELMKEGELDKDYELPCKIILNDAEAEESSLAENVCRAPMTKLDELEAYGRLISSDQYTAEQISQHFGRPIKEVRKTVALFGVAPEIREACRAGELSIDSLQDFTISTDHAQQLKVFQSLKKEGRLHGYQIREKLTSWTILSTSELCQFVTLKEYKKAGGRISSDLFREEIYLLQPDLLQDLAINKLDRAKAKLGEGWDFIEIDRNFRNWDISSQGYSRKKGNTDKAPAELLSQIKALKLQKKENYTAKIQKELEKAVVLLELSREYSDKEKASSGCIISISGRRTEIFKGLYKAKENKKENSQASADTQDPETGYSQKLKEDLGAVKHEVAKLAIANTRSLGFDLVLFTVVTQSIHRLSHLGTALDITIRDTSRNSQLRGSAEESPAARDLNTFVDAHDLDWLDGEDLILSFRKWVDLDLTIKIQFASIAAGLSLSSESWNYPKGFQDLILADTKQNIAKFWRPTAANFFSRVKKHQCLEYGAEIFEDRAWPQANLNKTRGELAQILSDKVEGMSEETCWLPNFSELDQE
jgi:ParB family chromosome partitioning protein